MAAPAGSGAVVRRRRQAVAAVVGTVVVVVLALWGLSAATGTPSDTSTVAEGAQTSAPPEPTAAPTPEPSTEPSASPSPSPSPSSPSPEATPSSAAPSEAATPSASAAPSPASSAPAPPPSTAPAPPPPAPSEAPSAAPTATPGGFPPNPGRPTGEGSVAAPAPAGGEVLFAYGARGSDVQQWQQRMADRGWSITVDGIYGVQSIDVARQFQAQKDLTVDGLVGPRTWSATWWEPITDR